MKVTTLTLLTSLFSVGTVAAHPVDRFLEVGDDVSDDEKDELLLRKILEDLPEPELKKYNPEPPPQRLRRQLQEGANPEDVRLCEGTWCGSCSPCFCYTSDFQIALELYLKNPNANYPWGDIEDWCTGRVENMGSAFRNARNFNADISGWDTGRVVSFDNMFNGARSFNQPIGVWNTESSVNMDGMFHGASDFNQPVGDWDVSKVEIMRNMFTRASSFNQPLENWDVRENHYFTSMFAYAEKFNQPLNGWGPQTMNVWFTSSMFYHANEFNQDLSMWNMNGVSIRLHAARKYCHLSRRLTCCLLRFLLYRTVI